MTDLHRDPCPTCGRVPAPFKVLRGFSPCICPGGHETRYCRADAGGCGTTMYVPPLTDRCKAVRQGF